ncbi:MAG: hypothetical protein GXY76_05260 [Chloroflexi bacterium]|nr:hypothetical protein [Chloroflexota bacterium]
MSTEQGNGQPDSDQISQAVQFWQQMPTIARVGLITALVGLIGRWASPRYSSGHTFFTFVLDVGILVLIVWIARLFIMPIVRKQQIVEEWGILIQGGQEHAAKILEQSRELITTSKAPHITMEEKGIAAGFLRGITGERRTFLVVTNRTNANLKSYEMYLSAREYGDNLQVSWYVIHWPSVAQVWLRLSMFAPLVNLFVLPIFVLMQLPKAGQAGLLDLDFFDLQDLKAYVTNAHHCVLDAVDKLLLDLSQDPSKIERKSRGFLGIS